MERKDDGTAAAEEPGLCGAGLPRAFCESPGPTGAAKVSVKITRRERSKPKDGILRIVQIQRYACLSDSPNRMRDGRVALGELWLEEVEAHHGVSQQVYASRYIYT